MLGDHTSTELVFGALGPGDFEELKALHERLLPVRYADKFYEEACSGYGLRKAPLYSVIVRKGGEMVGFLLAQFMNAGECEDRDLIVTKNDQSVDESDYDVMYILTLGCKPELQRTGMATAMLRLCIEHGKANPQCGAIYLHVIHDNDAAIKFYSKNGFSCERTLSAFYIIDQEAWSAYLYILYVNDCNGSSLRQLFYRAGVITDTLVTATLSWFTSTIAGIMASVAKASTNSRINAHSTDRDRLQGRQLPEEEV